MDATAITYRTGERRGEQRTILVTGARESVVLLHTGRLEIMQAKHLHGLACRHRFWSEQLGLDPESDDFAIPKDAVVQVKTIRNVIPRQRRDLWTAKSAVSASGSLISMRMMR